MLRGFRRITDRYDTLELAEDIIDIIHLDLAAT